MTSAQASVAAHYLPKDFQRATLLGRIDFGAGPTPVMVRNGLVEDLSAIAPTTSHLLGMFNDCEAIPRGKRVCAIEEFVPRRAWDAIQQPQLLAPVDLQCIKAAGVTFAVSTLERVIEERARGDRAEADRIRYVLVEKIGGDLRSVKPGSPQAAKLKDALIAAELWSQYLEVAIGPDAEIFTKAPVLASVGYGDFVGIRSDSNWNNPEPEIVLLCDSKGNIRGAALGNDVNLRDIEGRSALLLGKAKDNNASCAIGPFARLFDEHFSLDHLRNAIVTLEIAGSDGFVLQGESTMNLISRDPSELVAQTIGKHHSYPDGFALFLGTMFAPTQDRDAPGRGFTHKVGDRVKVSASLLGVLENQVTYCEQAPPWQLGIAALFTNLAQRGLLSPSRFPK